MKISRRTSFYGLVLFTTICIFILAINQRYSSQIDKRVQRRVILAPDFKAGISYDDKFSGLTTQADDDSYLNYISRNNDVEDLTALKIKQILDLQRRLIRNELQDYQNPKKYSEKYLRNLIIEEEGNPKRSVILSTWRSGSTFLGDILNAHPANFYHYEPLLHYGITQIRNPPLLDEAIKDLDSMFNCEYSKLDHYLEYGKNAHPWVFNHNTHLWKQCQQHKKLCWDHEFVTKFCKLFPFQSMKTVRLRVQAMEYFLKNGNKLGIKILLLIRDPRGILQSRKHREWCPLEPDCIDPAILCSDMVLDYRAAVQFSKKYPKNFRVIRYEELSMDPFNHTKELFHFFNLDFHDSVQRFLDTHTKTDIGGLSSTFRNSKTAPFHWRQELSFNEVQDIQNNCKVAMNLWGYNFAFNHTHQNKFDPVSRYNLVENIV